MCVTAIIAGASLLMSAVGTYSSMQAANAQADQARAVELFKRKQLSEQATMESLDAGSRELSRMEGYERQRSASLAAIGASGLGDHISFFQGIEPSNKDKLNDDIRAIRLNLVHTESQLADGITVSEYTSSLAGFNAQQSKIGAMAGFAGDVMGAYSFYNTNSVGRSGGG